MSTGGSLRIALLSYRSKPHCGGQGVYVRHLSRELVALGHDVEVFSGQPYPELDAGVRLTEVPSLDLYREPDPFRVPRLGEFRDLVDVEEFLTMCTAGFPEPKTFGTGWTTVVVTRLPKSAQGDQQSKVLLNSLPEVCGSWGKGRLLSTVLVNAVITDDGRVAVGSVVPESLCKALATR